MECRVFAIADAYDAMTNGYACRKPLTHDEALAELRRGAGIQFDPALVNVCAGELNRLYQNPR